MKKQRVLAVVWVSVLLLLWNFIGAGMAADAADGSISGAILSTEVRGIENVIVLAIDNATGRHTGSATTDADGAYHIDGLTPGQYTVQVYQSYYSYIPQYYRNAYDTASAEDVEVLENETTAGIDFELVRNSAMFDWESRNYWIPTTGSDPVPAVRLSPTWIDIQEASYGNNQGTYTVELLTQPADAVTISLQTREENQTTVTPGTLTFDATNWNVPQTVTVTAVDDDIVEGRHYDYVLHTAESTDTDYEGIGIGDVRISIEDDDLPAGAENPVLRIGNYSGYEHSSGMSFSVRLSATSDQEITVDYSTSDGTAKAGEDYEATSGTLTFAPGDLHRNFSVNFIEDDVIEPDETFTIIFENAVNAELENETGTVTIIDKIVVVTGPEWGISFAANETKTLTFTVKNRQNKPDIFFLHPVSTGYWMAELLSDEKVEIPARGEIPIAIRLTAPPAGSENRYTELALTAMKRPYTITASAGSGGTVQPSGTTLVFQGEDQTYTFSPADGYTVSGLTIDGHNYSSSSDSFIFGNVTANHTLSVKFSAVGEVVSPPDTPTGTAPVLRGTPYPFINVGEEFEFTPVADGGVGEARSFDIENQPAWAQFNSETGTLWGTPSASDVGTTENIVISVTDTAGNIFRMYPFNLAVIQPDINVETQEDKEIEILLSSEESEARNYVIVNPPEHGELSDISGGRVTYRPEDNYYGADMFTFKIEGRPDADAAEASITITPVNDPPVAEAGADITIEEGREITLSGADSADPLDPEGEISEYQWTQTAGPSVEIRTAETPGEARFTAPEVESGSVALSFQLMVTDDGGLTASDEITVTVFHNNPPEMPLPITPPDRTPIPGSGEITLRASGFADMDEDIHESSRWELRRYDRVYGAPGYDQAFDQLVSEGDLTAYTLSGLASGLKYGWRVTYGDAKGKGTRSGEYTFKVGTSVARDRILYGGKKPAHFPMVSFDQWPDNPSCMAVFGAEMGGEYDTRSYRIAAYDPVSNDYVECDEGLMIEPGRAYWFFTLDRITLTVNGIPVSRDHDLEVRLRYSEGTRNGWNMIAAPNGGDYQWADVEVIEYDGDGNIIFGPTAVGELAAENEYLDKQLWRWVDDKADGKYESGTTAMLRNNGYWIRAKKGGVFLRFPKAAQKNLGGGGAVVKNMLEQGKEWIGAYLPTVSEAVAGSTDTPPRPISGFEADTGADSSGGGSAGCFVKTAEE